MAEFENESVAAKAPTEVHKALSKYVLDTTGKKVSPAVAALVLRLYPVYLKSPAVEEAREAERKAKEEAKARKAEEKANRLKERLAKIEADRQRVLAELGLSDESPEDASARFTEGDDPIDFSDPEPEPEQEEEKPAPKKRAKKEKVVEPEPEPEDDENDPDLVEAEDGFVVADEKAEADSDDDDDWDDDEDDEEDF